MLFYSLFPFLFPCGCDLSAPAFCPFPHGRCNRADQPGASRRPATRQRVPAGPPDRAGAAGSEPNRGYERAAAGPRRAEHGRPHDGTLESPPPSGSDRALRRAGRQRPPVAARPCLTQGAVF